MILRSLNSCRRMTTAIRRRVPRELVSPVVSTQPNTHLPHLLSKQRQLSSAALSTTITDRPYAPPRDQCMSLWFRAAVATAAAVSVITLLPDDPSNTTWCETAVSPTDSDDNTTSTDCTTNEPDEEEEDPYDNLPEDDEETDCTICQTFRQGPCRTPWRKLERCFKDNESKNGDSNAGAKCMNYFMPHQECLSKYTNLYQLISLELKQELVHDTEKAVQPHERRKWKSKQVLIDWSSWKDFYQNVGPSYSQTVPMKKEDSSSKDEKKKKPSLWKRLPKDTEPVLVPIPAQVPLETKKQKKMPPMLLKFSYAIDQDGFVLGMQYNSKYGELLELSKKPKEEQGEQQSTASTNTSADREEENKPPPQEEEKEPQPLQVYLLPGETQSIQICAMYAEHPLHADPDKELLDVLLYKSSYYSLSDHVANKDDDDDSK